MKHVKSVFLAMVLILPIFTIFCSYNSGRLSRSIKKKKQLSQFLKSGVLFGLLAYPSLKIGLKCVEVIEYKFNILTSNHISYDRQAFFIFAINKAWAFLTNYKLLAGFSGQTGFKSINTVYLYPVLSPCQKRSFFLYWLLRPDPLHPVTARFFSDAICRSLFFVPSASRSLAAASAASSFIQTWALLSHFLYPPPGETDVTFSGSGPRSEI